MKIILYTCLLILLICLRAESQNLVPNPSFEDTLACPYQTGQMFNAVGWHNITESADYFNSCQSNSLNVPNTGFGYQNAKDGNAMVGFVNQSLAVSNIREYFGTQLLYPLITNVTYYASFYVSLADVQGVDCATNNMGIKFTTYDIIGPIISTQLINNDSKIYSTNIIYDKVNWINIKGSFIADSAYQYLWIGNFFSDQNTANNNCFSNSYYFFDSICLSNDSNDCYLNTGITTLSSPNIFGIYYNILNESVEIKYNGKDLLQIEIINSLGQKMISLKIISDEVLNISSWPSGVYFVKSVQNKNIFKIIKY